MYPTGLPQPWQQSVWVRQSQVRDGAGRQFDAPPFPSASGEYAEQFTGDASDEKRGTFGRNNSTA